MTPEEIAQLPYRPCVGVMLANPRGHIFVGQRIDRDQAAWQMPQGGVDKGERCIDATYRELWEETGVTEKLVSLEGETPHLIRYDLPHDIVPKIWKGKYRGQEQKWFLMRLDGPDTLVNIATDEPEFSHWAWMEWDELLNRIVPFKRHVYEEVGRAFADHLRR